MNRAATFYWHDYETFGTDPCRDRPAQFAGQRTTLDLEPVGEPLSLYCQPPNDVLPRPFSCLITGISPQRAARDGVVEAEFAARIHDEMSQPGTCSAGFNSLRFDDEFTRNLLYRNFYDPYAREWESGNSRWDIIDLARMAYALRPQGIEWPLRARSEAATPSAAAAPAAPVPSFRLEDLSAANQLAHAHAHDALSDVEATIALARLLRAQQPRLFDWFFALRRKQRAFELLDFAHRTPVLHVSSRYPGERGCIALVLPLAPHPTQVNKVIVYDLDTDPGPLLDLDADEIADRVFTARADLPDGVERIPLKAVSANKSPALAPLSALAGVDTARIRLDPARCLEHARRLQDADLGEKIRRVFDSGQSSARSDDADLSLYRGFPCESDRGLCRRVRATPPHELGRTAFGFTDARYDELLFRYRARNFPDSLSLEEAARWDAFRRTKLTTATEATPLTLDAYFAEIAALRASDPRAPAALLDALEQWGREIL